MGIPSYYKRLIDSVPGLIGKVHPGKINHLWMDFNCLIYHCLRRLPASVGTTGPAFEAALLEEVAAYTEKVVAEVRPTDGVYLAVDGVVPMAKMRQQRLRRFKNAAAAAAGAWDTNAITPGTAFMEKLRVRLTALCAGRTGWVLSAASEAGCAKRAHPVWELSAADQAGEGEHKIMAGLRTKVATGAHHAIYGLDADLIVLSLLNSPGPTWLFREEIEAGVIKKDDAGEECFTWFDVNQLRAHLCAGITEPALYLRDYCCAMSFLGNDFLPSSLSFKMRDDGHGALIDILNKLTAAGKHLVGADGEISPAGLTALLQCLAAEEEPRLLAFIKKKMRMAAAATGDFGLGQENWPLAERAEACLVSGIGAAIGLKASWRDIYLRTWFGKGTAVSDLVGEYVRGVYWIWDYYRGRPVCYNWHYPWTLPPLWGWLAASPSSAGAAVTPVVRATDIAPVEQLALVLPLSSWQLIPTDSPCRKLPLAAPWLFPTKFGYSSVGRRFFWECEAEIPVPTILEVKALCRD